jgi:sugar lactone lactonase YvrE
MAEAAKIERVAGIDNFLGETPVWSVEEQALYWINCEEPAELHRWSPGTDARDVWPMPRRIGGLVLRKGAPPLVVLADGLYDFEPVSGALKLRVPSPVPAHVRLHETGCDRQGRLWVGGYDHAFTPTNREACDAALLRLDGDKLTPVVPGVRVSNGMAFSPDGRTLYHSDSPTRRIDAFDLDPKTGALSNRRLFLELPQGEGFVDGAAVDAEGGYWLATVGLAQLRRYTTDGKLDRIVELPFSNPTKPAFGGPDLDVIYVTSTKLALTLPGVAGADQNGGLYAVRAGVRGLPEPLLREGA